MPVTAKKLDPVPSGSERKDITIYYGARSSTTSRRSDLLANPVVMHKAQGLFYWDVEGKRYFDGIGGILLNRILDMGIRGCSRPHASNSSIHDLRSAPPFRGGCDLGLYRKTWRCCSPEPNVRQALQRRLLN